MHESPTTERLSLRWVEVTDERGRTRLEMRWAEPVAAAAATPAVSTPALAATTHAA